VLNWVDTAMVGSLGDAALAASGAAGFANFMAVAFVMGLSSGVQALSARRFGEERLSELAIPLNGGLVLAVAMSVILCSLAIAAAPYVFPLILKDPAAIDIGVPYLRLRLLGMVFVGLCFAFRGYYNGIGESWRYLLTLVIMHAANILGNYVLIFGNFGAPEMGAPGAALSSTIAMFIGALVYFIQATFGARGAGFLRAMPSRQDFASIIKLALPAGTQQFLFAAGFTAFFSIVGRIGTQEAAAANALITTMLTCILPGIAFGIAAATLVGKSLGQGQKEDAYRWAFDVVLVAVMTMQTLGLVLFVFADDVLGIFLKNPETLALAILPLKLFGLTIFFDGIGNVLMNALLGAGAAKTTLVVSTSTQWLLCIPLCAWVGLVLNWGLVGVWSVFIGWRILQAAIYVVIWMRKTWADVDI